MKQAKAARVVARAPEPLVGVFATLAQQHAEVAALMDRVRADAPNRRALWPDLRRCSLNATFLEAYQQTAAAT